MTLSNKPVVSTNEAIGVSDVLAPKSSFEVSLVDLTSLAGPEKSVNVFHFSRGYGALDPREYSRVEASFLEALKRLKHIGLDFPDEAVTISRELFRNAFKHGTKNAFGGDVRLVQHESPTHFAYGILDGGDGIPQIDRLSLIDSTSPQLMPQIGGLHLNGHRRLKKALTDGIVEAIAFPNDMKGIYILHKKHVR
ncbi:MAG: hypothetical protein KKD39_00935 [Candidatus Altiarchaeota archaeon]|nr:hypothetical protein [Candidatus Altiarchaeota archaeon]